MPDTFTEESPVDSTSRRRMRPRSYSLSDFHSFAASASLPHPDTAQLRAIRNTILSEAVTDDMVLVNTASQTQYFGQNFQIHPIHLLPSLIAQNDIDMQDYFDDNIDHSGNYVSSFTNSDEYPLSGIELFEYIDHHDLDAENLLEDRMSILFYYY